MPNCGANGSSAIQYEKKSLESLFQQAWLPWIIVQEQKRAEATEVFACSV